MPSSRDQPTARTASSAETGSRSRKRTSTGRPESHDTPRSPRSRPASQTPYWTCQGWSRPKKRRKEPTTSGDAIEACPRSCSTTVPGISRTISKTRKLTPKRVSPIAARRCRR
jgi:hypothetical protein